MTCVELAPDSSRYQSLWERSHREGKALYLNRQRRTKHIYSCTDQGCCNGADGAAVCCCWGGRRPNSLPHTPASAAHAQCCHAIAGDFLVLYGSATRCEIWVPMSSAHVSQLSCGPVPVHDLHLPYIHLQYHRAGHICIDLSTRRSCDFISHTAAAQYEKLKLGDHAGQLRPLTQPD